MNNRYINDENIDEFNHYQSYHLDWELSDVGFQIAYLLEKHLGDTKKYIDDNFYINRLIESLEKLTDECNDLDIKLNDREDYLFGFSESNLFNLAVHSANARISKNELNEETLFGILHLIKKMHIKSFLDTKKKMCDFVCSRKTLQVSNL